MLEGTSNHFLNHEDGQGLQARSLLGRLLGQLSEVTEVDTTLVQQLGERLTVHREADVAVVQVLEQVGDDLGSQVITGIPDFLLILCPLLLLLLSLGHLAAENIGVESKVEIRDVNTILLRILLLRLALLGSLGGSSLTTLHLGLHVLAHLVAPV